LARGVVTADDARRIRAAYGAKLSMIDHHLGRVLDVLDAQGAWSDTAVILCTDHGHYLGEHDVFGKPGVPLYEPMSRIPLLVAWPGQAARSVDALTTTVDLHATLLDTFAVTATHRTHGHSLVPLLEGSSSSAVRDWALMGVWGREVHVTDGRHKYVRATVGANAPLSLWSNRWSTMPIHAFPDVRLPPPDDRAVLDHMPGSSIPVIRQPLVEGDLLPFWAATHFTGHHLWNVDDDPQEQHDLADGGAIEEQSADLLRAALESVEAPPDQFARLGLS
ncbi:MAG TPA: sulfatase-like hydrolase/transferase, partial [Acidimicrobiales bacterium]